MQALFVLPRCDQIAFLGHHLKSASLDSQQPKARMNASPSPRARGNAMIVVVLILIVIAAVAGGGYYLRPRLESVPPDISVSPNVDVLGVAPLEIRVTDSGTGLRSLTATLSQG